MCGLDNLLQWLMQNKEKIMEQQLNQKKKNLFKTHVKKEQMKIQDS